MTNKIIQEINLLPVDNILTQFNFRIYNSHFFNLIERDGAKTLIFTDQSGAVLFYDLATLSVLTKVEFLLSIVLDHSDQNLGSLIKAITSLEEYEIQSVAGTKPISKDKVLTIYFELQSEITTNDVDDPILNVPNQFPQQEDLKQFEDKCKTFLKHFALGNIKLFYSYNTNVYLIYTSNPLDDPSGAVRTEAIVCCRSSKDMEVFPKGRGVFLYLSNNSSETLMIIGQIGLSIANQSYLVDHDVALVINPSMATVHHLDSYNSIIFSHPKDSITDVIVLTLQYMQHHSFMESFEIIDKGIFFEIYFFQCKKFSGSGMASFRNQVERYYLKENFETPLDMMVNQYKNTVTKFNESAENNGKLALMKNKQYLDAFFATLKQEMYYNLKWMPDVVR